MRNLLLLLLICSYSAFAQEQVWRIYIVDQEGNPIPYAVIEADQRTSVTTNAEGVAEFALELAAHPYSLTVFAQGYKTQVVSNQDSLFVQNNQSDIETTIIMERSIINLSDVIVTASRAEQRAELSTVSVDVLKPYLITERAQSEIQNTVKQMSGVNVSDGSVSIRGGSGWSYGAGSRVLVLLDGMPLISPDAGQAQWSLIPTEAVRNMEIVKGAGSALYGTSAMNGIMNVNTLNPTLEPHTDIRMYQGFYDSPAREELKFWEGLRGWTGIQMNHTQITGEEQNHGLVIAGQAEYDAGFQLNVPDHRGRLLSKYTYFNPEAPEWKYEIMATGLWSKTGDALLWNGYDQAYVPLDSQATQTTGVDFIIDPKVTYKGENGSHTLRSRMMVINNNSSSESTDYYNASQLGFAEYFWQNGYYLNDSRDQMIVTAGASGQFGVSNSEVFQGRHDINGQAAFVQAEYLLPFIKFSGGVRYESLALDNTRWSRPVFRFGINGGTESTRYRFSYGEGFRFPTMAEVYTRTNVGALQVYPNTELKPESGWSSEIGVRQMFSIGSAGGYLDVAGFWMRYDNMMEFSFGQWGTSGQGFENFGFRSINIGSTEVPGVEATLAMNFDLGSETSLQLMGGVTWMNPRPLDSNFVYATHPGVFPWSPETELSYVSTSSNSETGILKYRYQWLGKMDAQFEYHQFMIGASLRYNDFMQNVDGIFVDPVFSQFIPGVEESRTKNTGGDWIVDLRFRYEFSSQFSLSLIVNNLTNLEYYPRPALVGPMRSYALQMRYRI